MASILQYFWLTILIFSQMELNMKELKEMLMGTLLVLISTSAFAGPDWEVIHQERRDEQARALLHQACSASKRHHYAKTQPSYSKSGQRAG